MEIIPETFQDLLVQFLLFLPQLVSSIVVFGIALIAARSLSRIVRGALERREISAELTQVMATIARWSVIVLGIIVALQQVNFDIAAFLTGLGILGFTIGFALQDVSKNFIAGLLLLLQQPFNISDDIEVGEFRGVVEAVDLRATTLRLPGKRKVLIPNADVLSTPIVNYGTASRYRVALDIGVSHDSDLDVVRQITINAITNIAGVLDDPAPPRVFFKNLGPWSVDFTAYYWIDTEQINILNARDVGVRAIKSTFEQANIEMPYPTQTVYLRQS